MSAQRGSARLTVWNENRHESHAAAGLPFEVRDGYVHCTVSFDAGHCLVVLEGE